MNANGMKMVLAVSDAIRELKQVPNGQLYASIMGHISLETYTKIIEILKETGCVKEENHLLTWTGK